jgi:hypothetical protein
VLEIQVKLRRKDRDWEYFFTGHVTEEMYLAARDSKEKNCRPFGDLVHRVLDPLGVKLVELFKGIK